MQRSFSTCISLLLAFLAVTTSFDCGAATGNSLRERLDSALVTSGMMRKEVADRDVRYIHNGVEFVKVTGPVVRTIFEGHPSIGIILTRDRNKANIDKFSDTEKMIGKVLEFSISDRAKMLHRLVKSNIADEFEPFLTSDGRCYVSVSIDKVLYVCKSSS